MMVAKKKSRLVVFVLLTSMLLQLFGSVAVYAADDDYVIERKIANSTTLNSLDEMADLMVSTSYEDYLEQYASMNVPDYTGEPIRILGKDHYVPELSDSFTQEDLDEYADLKVLSAEEISGLITEDNEDQLSGLMTEEIATETDGKILCTPSTGKVSFKVSVSESAMYTVMVNYYPIGDDGWDSTTDTDNGHGSNIERILLVDGIVPYKEARRLSFSRVWGDEYENGYDKSNYNRYKFTPDANGNEMRPIKVEMPEWRKTYLLDSETFFSEPLKVYLEAEKDAEGNDIGPKEHIITFDSASEPMAIAWIEIGSSPELITYKQYLEQHKDAKTPSVKDGETKIMIHAEQPYRTSERVIYAMNDRTSGITIPQDPAKSLLNTIGGNGGDKWKNPGQWIAYKVTVTEDGWYEIVPRFKQTVNQGLFSSRSIKIDGEYPFAEAKNLQFKYGDDWQVGVLNDGSTNFKFYLTAGEHEIALCAVLGEMSEVLNDIESIQTNLNDYYRQILMITGSEPDEYTDYEFSKLIPAVITGMKREKQNLDNVSKDLQKKIGTKGENTVILDRIAFLLDEMSKKETKIASNLGNLKSYIGSLGTWLLSTKAQPLQLDYIMVQPAGTSLPRANANFFESMGHEFSSFFSSFFTDYNSIGAKEKIDPNDPNSVEVWITTGRDQATIMRQMVDNGFNKDISVNLKLIAAGTLLPATLAGVGPDVSMDGDPVGYGIRNAVVPLNYFESETVAKINDRIELGDGSRVLSFSEVKETYFGNNEELFVPLTVLDPDRVELLDEKDESKGYKVIDGVERNGIVTYGLPYTIDFPMLFYRKDIFVELGLEVPETWDDVEGIIRALSENQMEMGFSQAMTQIYMYQSGHEWFESARDYAEYYPDGEVSEHEYLRTVGMASNLGSNGALDAFQRMTEWFTLYGEPVSYDFANRFRTGEMPIAIAAYSTYNQLKVFAPEISGLWEFVQLPGVIRTTEDGRTYIDHSTPGTPQAVMMMKDAADDIKEGQDITESKKAQNAWAFLQWWISTDTQNRFGQEQVALMGTAAKYNTANVQALVGQSWTGQEKKNLMQQFESLKGTPMSPGNYIVARYTNFAFYNVVDDGKVASEAMRDYVDDIDHELSRKRAEYGFLTQEEFFKEKGIKE